MYWCTGCGLARYLRALAAEKNGHSSSSATNYVGYVKHESVKHERVKHEKMSATGQETLNAVIFDWGVIRAYQKHMPSFECYFNRRQGKGYATSEAPKV